jgi:thymidine phosphorylase
METLTTVDLTVEEIRRVVDQEGACLAWGGAVRLSPADDILIRVERSLNLDSEGQLVASVLSKKRAAGSTHVVIDVPVGPTAKVRTHEAAELLRDLLVDVGRGIGLTVQVVLTNGNGPVGRGVGPALEAVDVLKVLRCDADAPDDLRERALFLAGYIFDLAGHSTDSTGMALARRVLEDGTALRKFEAICAAQGGFREPGRAVYTQPVAADREGIVASIDNRRLANVAKLAGAPHDATAGVYLDARLGSRVERGQSLYTVCAESRGELEYALNFVESMPTIMTIGEDA